MMRELEMKDKSNNPVDNDMTEPNQPIWYSQRTRCIPSGLNDYDLSS